LKDCFGHVIGIDDQNLVRNALGGDAAFGKLATDDYFISHELLLLFPVVPLYTSLPRL
jgi:hypothetical protein